MPRPTRSQGRPDTKVIPTIWETSHAPVVSKTMTGTCVITAQRTTDVDPIMNADLTYTVPTPAAALYQGSCRVQALKANDNKAVTGEQDQRIATYLVSIERDAAFIPVGAVVKFTASSDETLDSPRRFVVKGADRGTLRFERDLYCVDDMTRE